MLQTDLSQFFLDKCIVRRVMEACESWTPCFLCRSQLLSITVLNDCAYELLMRYMGTFPLILTLTLFMSNCQYSLYKYITT